MKLRSPSFFVVYVNMIRELNYLLSKYADTSYMDDQFSITIDGASEEIDILDNLRESSDPAKFVLDIILNPIIPLPKKGDEPVIIDESRIYLLEKLMTISPNIKPCVRDEALKLAHELKANMKENTQNSLEVLRFQLILSIYGLLAYFDGDEVLKLFESVAGYKMAAELFETLHIGFAKFMVYMSLCIVMLHHITCRVCCFGFIFLLEISAYCELKKLIGC